VATSDSPRVALITGGTTGIGRATARVLREQGFAVVVTGQNPDTIAAAQQALPDDVTVLRADARVLADATSVADEIRRRHGRLDAVFLNAGIGRMLPIEAVDEATFDDIFGTNVKGQFFTLQAVLPLLRDGGSVVLMSALGVSRGAPNYSVPTATRGAMMAMVAPLAVELEKKAGFADFVSKRVLVGRMGADEDVARVVAFLVSPAAGFITGARIPIDGGMGVA
jgi:NAD(P)-dependent dehydrogenase (short-subunit alcohol dehydrogenase family)